MALLLRKTDSSSLNIQGYTVAEWKKRKEARKKKKHFLYQSFTHRSSAPPPGVAAACRDGGPGMVHYDASHDTAVVDGGPGLVHYDASHDTAVVDGSPGLVRYDTSHNPVSEEGHSLATAVEIVERATGTGSRPLNSFQSTISVDITPTAS